MLEKIRQVGTTTAWLKFAEVPELHAVGKDVCSMHTGCHVLLYDTREHSLVIHHASGGRKGDGVRCLAGHQALTLFAFAEMCLRPRIMVFSYPSMTLITALIGQSGGGYQSLAFTEADLIVSLSMYPMFTITVWSWRTGDRLGWQESGVADLHQSLRCGLGLPAVVCQVAEGSRTLTIWEVGVCGKLRTLTKREVTLPGTARSGGVAWSSEELHIVDTVGNIYTVGRECQQASLSWEWRGENVGATPTVTWFKAGLVLSGPDATVQHLKRTATGWSQTWLLTPTQPLVRLANLASTEILLGMSAQALLYQLQPDDEQEHGGQVFVPVQYYGSGFSLLCLLQPTGEHCVTLSRHNGILSIWHANSGAPVAAVSLRHEYLAMVANPSVPYVVLSRTDGALDFINFHKPGEPQAMDQVWLCSEPLDDVQFIAAGRLMVAAVKPRGWLFLLEGRVGRRIEVLSHVDMGGRITDYALLEGKGAVLLVVLLPSLECCGAGSEVALYRKEPASRMFSPRGPPHLRLCGNYVRLCTWPSAVLRLFAIPHQSKQVHLLQLHGDRDEQILKLEDAGLSCHQLRRFGLSVGSRHLLSYGADGLVAFYELPSLAGQTPVVTHHRHAGGVRAAVADKLGKHLICLGYDGSLVCITITDESDDTITPLNEADAVLKVFVPPIKTLNFDTGDLGERRTWLQTQQDLQQMREAMAFSTDKTQIMEEFQALKKQLALLLEANQESPPEKQLPVAEFDLDKEGRARKLHEAQLERERTRERALALCRAQDELSAVIKKKYWEPMEVKGHVTKAFTAPYIVENYPVRSVSKEFQEELNHVVERRRLELAVNKNFFKAWVPRTPSSLQLELSREPLESQRDLLDLRQALLVAEHMATDEAEVTHEMSGSTSHRHVELLRYHHSQYELVTHLQFYNESVLLKDVIQRLRRYFNLEFDKVLNEKKNALQQLDVVDRRLKHVTSELNISNTTVVRKLRLTPLEEPHTIMTVEDHEVAVSPYISPSHQALLDQHAAGEEAQRQAELADNFRELALIDMMGGVLEVCWEDEIKKDVPLPKCMVERTPEEYTEQDLQEVKEYEERVRALQVERVRYSRMLEQEFDKLLNEQQELMGGFDKRLSSLHKLKLQVDKAIKQEQLKILRARLLCHRRAQLDTHEIHLLNTEKQKGQRVEETESELQQLQQALEEMRVAHESLLARDKQLEKQFRKNAPPDLPSFTLEQLSKAYKRRPKMHQRLQTSAWMLGELSHLCLSANRPVFLPPESEDFLKGLDALDNFSGAPPNITEDMWATFVHSRRLKVESELRVKNSGLEVIEAEATVTSTRKQLTAIKEEISALQAQQAAVRADKLHLVHNKQIQLVTMQGNVEVPITGQISDFENAVLIDRDTVESINQVIKEKGKAKLSVMRENANVRRIILHRQWQHKKLSMQLEDLKEHIHTLEGTKVTREIGKFLRGKPMRPLEDKGAPVEREIQLLKKFYDKSLEDLKSQIQQLDQRIVHFRRHNSELDIKVAALNIDVNEQHLQRDLDLEAREAEATQRRMSSIVKRSQLVRRIQCQHNKILLMQTELELLRLKTFPTLRYKSSF